jgi:signal transduction histidine kinase
MASLRSRIPPPLRSTLLRKLFLGLLGLLLVAGLTASIFYIGVEDQLDDQVDTQVRETANLQSQIFAAWFDSRKSDLAEVKSILQALATEDEDPGNFQRDLQSEALENALANHNEFSAFHLVDPDTGRVLASSNDAARNESYEPGRFRAAEFVIGQYESVTGDRVMAIGDPLGTQVGVILVGEVNATNGGPTLQQTISGSQTVVVNASGRPLLGEDWVEDESLVATASDTRVTERDEWIYASTRIRSDRYLVTRSPTTEAFVLQERILRSFLVTLLITFGLLAVLVGLGGRSIQRALMALGDRARAMEDGDLDVDLRTDRVDEIGDLYGSFAAMRDALREQLLEVQRARDQAEQLNEQLQVVSRILRHNLRNNLNTIQAHAQMLQGDETDSVEEHARTIEAVTTALLETADKQHTITEALEEVDSPSPMDIRESLVETAESVAREYPEADVTVDLPAELPALAIESIDRAVVELLENAIHHNDADTPRVELAGRSSDETIEVLIRDNGPYIPEIEYQVLGEGEIDPLNHGSSIGLWLAHVLVRQAGGELLFRRTDRGNEVTIRLERAELKD